MTSTTNPNDRGFCISPTCLEDRFPHLAHAYPRDYLRADGSPSGYELQRRDYEADDR